MTTTAPAQTANDLREQLRSLREEHDQAVNNVGKATEHHGRLRGRKRIGEATKDEVDRASEAIKDAEGEAAELADAVAEVTSRLSAAEAREADAARAELVATHASQYAGWRKSAGRYDRHLTSVGNDAAELGDFERELRSNRARLTALLDREEEIREEFEREGERKVAEGSRLGQLVNWDTLARRRDDAIAAMRAGVARQVDELLPLPDPAELDAVRAKHADLVPELIGPDLRRAIAEGEEFVRRPDIVGLGNSFVGMTSQRIYAAHEGPAAEARYSALVNAFAQLKGNTTAPTLAQITSGGAEPTVVHR